MMRLSASGPLATSAAGRWQARFDRLPPLAWLGLHAAALWPHWRWAAARMSDGSDDPLGLAAIAVLALCLWRARGRMAVRPDLRWLAAAGLLTLAATLGTLAVPPLLAAVCAALALACSARAFLPAGHATLPLAGLALLALPVVSSLQFYAGYPLRLVTAEASMWLLRLAGMAAERSGASMQVEGRLIIVDAPCSGVQMVWMAYFCACAVAAWHGLRDRSFVSRLPFLGLAVMAGNVLRNSVLVALEARQVPVSDATHQAIGLVVLAAVCASVVWLIGGGGRDDRV